MTWLSEWASALTAQTVPFSQAHSLAHPLAWTLVHFLWQGALVAGLVAVLLRLTARTEAQVRHGICLAGLAALALLPMVTYITVSSSQELAAARAPSPFLLGDALASRPAMAPWMPLVCLAWALGAGWFQLRALAQLLRARDLSRRGAQAAPAWLIEMVEGLRRRLDLPHPIKVMSSTVASVPAVIGWLSPVVLIPLGALGTLPPEQLRAVLAHELAHVRRHDYLVNLLQLLLESTLFFHPAVWWIGARLRDEREYCCDDLAVDACGDPLTFARALSTLDALRKPAPLLSALPVSSQGGSLLKRITRLVDQTPRRSAGLLVSSTLGMLMLSTVAASGAVAALCDDACLVEAVTIRDGLTVINTDGHDANCTLLLARDGDGPMKVRCIDHVLSDKVHEHHAVLPGRVHDHWTVEEVDEATTPHTVIDVKRRLGSLEHTELELLEEDLNEVIEEVWIEDEPRAHSRLHESSEHEVGEYIILEERANDFEVIELEVEDRLPTRQYRKLETVHVLPDEQHLTLERLPRVQHHEVIVEAEDDLDGTQRSHGKAHIDVGEYRLRRNEFVHPEANVLLEVQPRLHIQRQLPVRVEIVLEEVPAEQSEPGEVIEEIMELEDV